MRRALTFDQTVSTLLFLTVLAAACLMPLQNDTWWHLRAGEEMSRRGFVMLKDEFSFTASGAYWPNHEWLSEIVFYNIYRIGGLPLLTLFAAVAVTAAIGLSWRLMAGPALLRFALVAAAIPSLAPVWTVRPHVFTQVLLMVAIQLCLRRARWTLPLLFALWANLHGGVALGFVVLGAALLADLYLRDMRRARSWLTVIAVSFAATMLAPLGFNLWLTIPESIQKSIANGIAEWQPPRFGWADLGFWLLATAFVAAMVRRYRSIVTFDDALLAILALMLLPLAARHSRNMAPFALVAVPALTRMLRLDVRLAPAQRRRQSRLNVALVGACVVVAVITVSWAWTQPIARLRWSPLSPAIVNAVQHCPGRLYNRFDDGGYIIWFARVPVYTDSRQDPYPLPFLQEHLQHEVSGEYASVFAKYDLNCAVLPPSSPTAHRMLRDGWRLAASDRRWVVLYPAS